MARERRRTRPTEIYNNDATVITATPAEEKPAPAVQRRSVGNSVDLNVTDVIDTIASYVSKPKWFERELADRPGQCLICKKATMCKIRKICADCMNKYSGDIYDLASEAVENGQTSITLNTVE